MEIVFEILFFLLQLVGEIVLQVVLEVLVEFGMHSVAEPFRRRRPVHPVVAAIGYALLGALAGAISLWIFPALFIDSPNMRIVNLLVTPVAAGAVMALVGAWRRKRDDELVRLDRFAYGFLFALSMALVRYTWGH